ncbi:MAG: hypothetical protein ACREBU_15170 [Nitrososphaera sp.]
MQKKDLIILLVLAGVVIAPRLILIFYHADTMFDIDPYRYYSSAQNIARGEDSSVDPYLLFLSAIITPLGESPEVLLILRILNISFAIQLAVFVYLTALKMFNRLFALVTALFASFLPLSLAYSINLHNDIFTLAMFFTSLYFVIAGRLRTIALAVPFILVAGLTRFDTLIILLVLLVCSGTLYMARKWQWKLGWKLPVVITVECLVIFSAIYVITQEYYLQITRFNPVEKTILFVRADILTNVWEDSVTYTGQQAVDILLLILILASVPFLIVLERNRVISFLRGVHTKNKQQHIVAIFLTISFFISLYSIMTYHVNYTIEGEEVLIDPTVTPRYLLIIQILSAYGFAYGLKGTMDSIDRLMTPKLTSPISNRRSLA